MEKAGNTSQVRNVETNESESTWKHRKRLRCRQNRTLSVVRGIEHGGCLFTVHAATGVELA
jgi:hypothetical protein